jgi:hypothetical protein
MMSRKLVAVTVTISAALGLSVPAIAKSGHARRSERVVMTGRVLRGSLSRPVIIASGGLSSTLSHQGFACEVIVGQGTDDATYLTHWTQQSSEFYIRFDVRGVTRYSVTSNCIGQLPPGTPHSAHIVSHTTANCGQINPFNASKFIKGWGLTTTYPSGMYSETCNTPAFKL